MGDKWRLYSRFIPPFFGQVQRGNESGKAMSVRVRAVTCGGDRGGREGTGKRGRQSFSVTVAAPAPATATVGSGSGQERGLLLTWRVGSVGTGTRESGAALQSSGATTCDKSGGKCLQLNLERSKMEKSGGHLERRCTHPRE